jgi:hypothetical protein
LWLDAPGLALVLLVVSGLDWCWLRWFRASLLCVIYRKMQVWDTNTNAMKWVQRVVCYMPGGVNSKIFQMDSNLPELWLFQKVPPLAPKIGNKIWLERAWNEKQLFLNNFPQIRNGIWTKNQRNFYELNFNRNLLEILGTLDFNEIWPESSLLHLIARKNKFPSKENQKFEFH